MKNFLIFITIVFMNNVNSQECKEPMEERLDNCCGTEVFGKADAIRRIFETYDNQNLSHIMKECKVNEDIFNELNITKGGDVEMEATYKLFDNTFSDKVWSESFKSAADICFKEVTANFAAIQSKFEAEPFNLKREDCNVKFMAIHSCVSLETVINCPKKFSVSTDECENGRKWLHKCVRTQDIHSILEMIMMHYE